MIHINRFVDLIKATESRGGRDIILPMRDAKDLHAEITKLLLSLETLRSNATAQVSEQVIKIDMDGGSFK